MSPDLATVQALVAVLPLGVVFRRRGSTLLCRPADTSEAELGNLQPAAFASELDRRCSSVELVGLEGLAEWWRMRLLAGALARSRVRPASTSVSGLRLVRLLWERLEGAAPEVETTGAEEDDRQRLALWSRSVERCPAPAVPGFLRQVEDELREGAVAWIAGALFYFDATRVVLCRRVHTVHEVLGQELVGRPELRPLVALARCRAAARDADPAAEHRRDLRLLGALALHGTLRGSAPAYRALSIHAQAPAAARVLVALPEHLAETGQAGVCAWWPAASAGFHVDFQRSFDAMLPAEFQTWSPGIAAHPLVSTKVTAQQGHAVCVADSTTLLGSRLAARFPGAAGRVAAEQLVCLRNGFLYGVHARLGTPVFQPYSKSVVAPDTRVPLLTRERAAAVARENRLELVPWER